MMRKRAYIRLLGSFCLSAFVFSGLVVAQQGDWSVKGAVYAEDMLKVGGHAKNTRAVDFKTDGTMIYALGRSSGNVVAFRLTKPWTLSSGEYVAEFDLKKHVGHKVQGQVPHGLFIRKSDGAKMYIWNRTEAFEYDLKTPWDITTAQLAGYFEFGSPVVRGHDIDISPDGVNFYIDDRGTGKIFQYKLEKPWSIDTAKYRYELDIKNIPRAMRGCQLSPSGKQFFLLDTSKRCVFEFHLGEAWDIRTAKLKYTLDISKRFKSPRGITWRPDGGAFFVTETSGDTIHAYGFSVEFKNN